MTADSLPFFLYHVVADSLPLSIDSIYIKCVQQFTSNRGICVYLILVIDCVIILNVVISIPLLYIYIYSESYIYVLIKTMPY